MICGKKPITCPETEMHRALKPPFSNRTCAMPDQPVADPIGQLKQNTVSIKTWQVSRC
jgi:hypothetical protein